MMLRITVLLENHLSSNRSLSAAHGLSLLVEDGRSRVLFDCGPDDHFMRNAHRLGIDLSALDAAVISHSHYDHAGGMRDFIEAGYRPGCIAVGTGFSDRKLSRHGSAYADLSAGWDEAFASSAGIPVIQVGKDMDIAPSMRIVTGFGKGNGFEVIPERFVKETDGGIIADMFNDEIALLVQSSKGNVLIVGCSHPGIVGIVETVKERYGSIHALIGGTHLAECSPKRIGMTLAALEESGIALFGLCHCTGNPALEEAERRGIPVTDLGCGDTIII